MSEDFPNQPRQSRPPRRWVGMAFVGLLGVAVGGLAAGYIASQPIGARMAQLANWPSAKTALPTPPANTSPVPLPLIETQGAMEMRVGALEHRLARIDLEAEMASSNAARAEALLVAFSSRRAIERGTPLGYLEDQLKLRFGEAQPKAVATLIAMSQTPITLDRLAAQLESMAPSQESSLARVKRELSNLFVLRHEQATPSPDPQLRLDHARICLHEGRIEDAIADLQRLPGGTEAQGWIMAARRYAEGQAALDAIEATALLEPRNLRNGTGEKIGQAEAVTPSLAGAANATSGQ